MKSKEHRRALFIGLLVLWIGLGVCLILFWHRLPSYISWPLAIIEFAIGSDSRLIKIALGIDKSDN